VLVALRLMHVAVLVRTCARRQIAGLVEYPASRYERVAGAVDQAVTGAGHVLAVAGVIAGERPVAPKIAVVCRGRSVSTPRVAILARRVCSHWKRRGAKRCRLPQPAGEFARAAWGPPCSAGGTRQAPQYRFRFRDEYQIYAGCGHSPQSAARARQEPVRGVPLGGQGTTGIPLVPRELFRLVASCPRGQPAASWDASWERVRGRPNILCRREAAVRL
jgi:hypothetical protein